MLLAIDTATRFLSLALHNGQELIAEQTAKIGNHHTTELAPTLATLMASCDVSANDLTALAVSIGPGSYTGVRIGVAMAKGLATVNALPLVGVSTLDVLAAGQPYFQSNGLITVVQAGRGRIIVRSYRWRKGRWTSRAEPEIMDWEHLLDSIDGSAYISGEVNQDGMDAISAAQAKGVPLTLVPAANRLRRAGFLAEVAWEQLNESDDHSAFAPARLIPVYLKSED